MKVLKLINKIYSNMRQPELTVRDSLIPDAVKLVEVLMYATELKQYKKGYTKRKDGTDNTFCNILARDILEGENLTQYDTYMGTLIDDYRYDVSSVFPNTWSILNMTIPEAQRRARIAAKAGLIKKHTPQTAQRMANIGVVIWIVSGEHNHEAIVCPDMDKFDIERGVKLGQAGGTNANGIMYISDRRSWGRLHKSNGIEYYEFPDKKRLTSS